MKGCFICPIYDKGKDFEYGYHLIDTAIRYTDLNDLYFIFSTREHQDKFLGECQRRFGRVPGALIYEADMSDSKNPVTVKKFFGIRMLMDQYDYIATIDCECVFVRQTDAGKLMDEIWNENTYLACGRSVLGGRDLKNCIDALGLGDNELLKRETADCSCTWWFNEIPIYKSENLGDFFAWLDKDNLYDTVYYTWECFDYLVYVIWLLLYKDKHLKIYDYESHMGMIESLCHPNTPHKYRAERDFHTHWTSRRNLFPPNPRIHLKFHLDRQTPFFKRVKRWILKKTGIRKPD